MQRTSNHNHPIVAERSIRDAHRTQTAGSQAPPSRPNVARAPTAGDRIDRGTPASPGLGFGVTVGAAAEGGLGIGAGASAGAGAGLFVDARGHVAPGAFASAGAFSTLGGRHTTATASEAPGAIGAYAGAGVGIFLTNAANARELTTLTQTQSINVGVELVKGSLQLSTGNGRFALAITLGPGGVADVSRYPTSTVTTP